jgi:phosphoglycerate kinase
MLRTLKDLGLQGRRVLVRVDFNVPLKEGRVADDTRLRAALPTIKYLQEKQARIILMSHLGRPKGKPVDGLRMDPVARRLAELLGMPVKKLDDCIGERIDEEIERLKPGEVVLLENLRFHPGETANDPEFSKKLARLGELFINDAFGTAHRAHASTFGVAQLLPSAAGLLLESEVKALRKLLEDPERPYWAMVGGAKLKDKIQVLSDLLSRVEGFMIGGAIAFSLLRAQGFPIGKSLIDEELIPEAEKFLKEAEAQSVEVLLPEDVVVAEELSPNAPTRVVTAAEIPEGSMGLDIGPRTVERFAAKIQGAKTLLWAGPLGAFETPPFGEGTFQIARAIARSPGTYAVIGGGDTASALNASGVKDAENIYVSTGGGAALAFLGGRTLPALEVLEA